MLLALHFSSLTSSIQSSSEGLAIFFWTFPRHWMRKSAPPSPVINIIFVTKPPRFSPNKNRQFGQLPNLAKPLITESCLTLTALQSAEGPGCLSLGFGQDLCPFWSPCCLHGKPDCRNQFLTALVSRGPFLQKAAYLSPPKYQLQFKQVLPLFGTSWGNCLNRSPSCKHSLGESLREQSPQQWNDQKS